MRNEISIAGRKIGLGHPPYVIAEMSANHNGKIETAMRIIEEAKNAGADAVKMQTYTAETLTLNCELPDFQINDGLWAGRTLYELYEWAHTPWDWHKPLFDRARDLGMTIFSSPFDTTAIDLLEDLNTPAYKIASFEAVDLVLIRYAASTGKPMIISTGMASIEEINEAITTAQDAGCKELAILHCVSGYPAPVEEYNLRTIPDMIERYGLVTGLSDHSMGNTTAVTSVSLGASIIEKHFTLNRMGGGPDDSFSLEPSELADLCKDTKTAWNALGTINYKRTKSEEENLKFRRSLYFVKDMNAGDVITSESVRAIRPGYGLHPKYLEVICGKILLKPVRYGTPVDITHISKN